MKVAGLPDISCEEKGAGRIALRGLKGGHAYHIGMYAGLGSFDIGRLFFTLPPTTFRKKSYVIGPIDTQFADDNRWLPPRVDCHVNGEFFFSFWFRVPTLAELLNDPRTRAALPPLPGLAKVNADDGKGERRFRFFGEGSVIVPRDGMTVELSFTGEGGLPELEEVSVWPDSRYERALRLDIALVRSPFPRLFLQGRNGEAGRKFFAERSPDLFATFTRLLEEKLVHPSEPLCLRNTDGLEHWDDLDRATCYAFGYALLGKEAYYEEALKVIEASLALPHWGMKCAEEDAVSQSGAHSNLHWDNDMCQGVTRILAVILFNDWCYDRLTPDLRQRIERKLLHHGELLFRFSLAGLGCWPSEPWSDHNTGTMYALQLLGFLFGDRDERAALWHRWGRVYFEDWRTNELFNSKNYCSPQRFNPIVGYIHHTRALLNEDLAKPSDMPSLLVIKRLIACRSGRPDWVAHELYGCDAQLHFAIAALYRDAHAQWLADNLCRRPIKGWIKTQGFRKVLELIYRDPALAPLPPVALPRHFHDAHSETFWYRESWDSLVAEGAGEEVLAVLENSRESVGVDLQNPHTPRYDWGPAPFRGHFSLIRGCTEYLSKPLSGYVNYTRNANCLLVDGRGQISEGAWHPATITAAKLTRMETPSVTLEHTPAGKRRVYAVRLDLSPAYATELNVRWVRTFSIWEAPLAGNRGRFERLEIVDEVTTDRPRDIVFYCHSQAVIETLGQTAIFKGENADLELELKADNTPLSLKVACSEYVTTYIAPLGEEPRHLAIRPQKLVEKLRLEWVFTFSNGKKQARESFQQ